MKAYFHTEPIQKKKNWDPQQSRPDVTFNLRAHQNSIAYAQLAHQTYCFQFSNSFKVLRIVDSGKL